jgi:hypothetical protein
MTRLITRNVVVPIGLVAALAWSTPSRADDEAAATPTAAPTTSVAAPPAAYGPATPAAEEPTTHTRKAAALLFSGFLLFGLTYAPAAYVAGDSRLAADRRLYVPIAGPWLDFAHRPRCGETTPSCGNEPLDTTLLWLDGFVQAISALEVAAGLVELAQDDSPPYGGAAPALKPEGASVRVTPTALGARGYGLGMSGRF